MTRPHLAALAAAFYVGVLAGTWAERQPRRSPTAARQTLAQDATVTAEAAELVDHYRRSAPPRVVGRHL